MPQKNADEVLEEFAKAEINIRKIRSNLVACSFDETTFLEDIGELTSIFAKLAGKEIDMKTLFHNTDSLIKKFPEELQRKSKFM